MTFLSSARFFNNKTYQIYLWPILSKNKDCEFIYLDVKTKQAYILKATISTTTFISNYKAITFTQLWVDICYSYFCNVYQFLLGLIQVVKRSIEFEIKKLWLCYLVWKLALWNKIKPWKKFYPSIKPWNIDCWYNKHVWQQFV